MTFKITVSIEYDFPDNDIQLADEMTLLRIHQYKIQGETEHETILLHSS